MVKYNILKASSSQVSEGQGGKARHIPANVFLKPWLVEIGIFDKIVNIFLYERHVAPSCSMFC